MNKWVKISIGLTALAVVCILVMTLGRTAESWSQNHNGEFDLLLYPTLASITIIYLLRALFHEKRGDKLFWKFNQGDWNLVTAFMFLMVLTFGVNHPFGWVQSLHIVFTGLAIVSASVGYLFYHKSGVMLHGAILGISACGILFLFAFLGTKLTTAEGEMIITAPLLIFNVTTIKKQLWKHLWKS